jgi:GDP-L-fucose synthase
MRSGDLALVTGASGLIGSALVRRLLQEDVRVRATAHNAPPWVDDDRVEYVRADLLRQEDCRRCVAGASFVFMCAASTSGAAVIQRTPMVHVTPNVVMNSLMLEAAYQANVKKVLYLSSTTGYPAAPGRPVHEEEMFTGDPYEKYYFVGWVKRFSEILCNMYTRLPEPMTTIVLRPTNVYGPRDKFDFATSHVTAAIVRRVVERHRPLTIWGTGNDVRDLIYVDDMVEAMVRAMRTLDSHDVINIGLGKGYSVKEILRIALAVDGYEDAEIDFDISAPTMIPDRLVDVTKAERVLGFRAGVDLAEGLERTIKWYRSVHRQLPG